jgi:hypothetical protein
MGYLNISTPKNFPLYPITYHNIGFTLFSWTTKPEQWPNLYIRLSSAADFGGNARGVQAIGGKQLGI